MEQIFNLLGFTNIASILWNLLAYAGMILITVAVVSAKWRNQFFVWGPLALLLYAWFYLHNPILAGLQLVVTTSGVLNLRDIKKPAPFVVITLAVMVFAALLATGQISGLWPWIGAFGLLGIALGLTQLPHKRGFGIMASGGLLIVIYALALQIWVFFVLNAIFFVANLLEMRKK
ncbi:MAG: hypothetical protein COT36_03635 [Parcubacteria group bacterium CG08_land_8_20_14_0_20_38_56]|nr:MAG: hypothetical protein COT36_03635 [Parcubacteria group bacterium CG08_land_8_20_14_0_20_38_56]